MNLISKKIYDTARNLVVEIKDLQPQSGLFNFNQDSLESIIDRMEIHNDLITYLAEESIDYNDADLQGALSIAISNLNLAHAELNELFTRIANNSFITFFHIRHWVVGILVYGLFLLFELAIGKFSLDTIFFSLPKIIVAIVVVYLITIGVKSKKNKNEYDIELKTQYLINKLIACHLRQRSC
jgi:hypothetical protein